MKSKNTLKHNKQPILSHKVLLVMVLLAIQICLGQLSPDLLLERGGGANPNAALSQAENQLIMRAIAEQRQNQGGIVRTSTPEPASALSGGDTVLGSPMRLTDTTVHYLVRDTLPLDSPFVAGIAEDIGRTEDGRSIVLRHLPVALAPRTIRRFESDIFATIPPTLFGSISSSVTSDYPIKADDLLVLTLWGDVEREYKLPVNNQGRVLVESIGMVSLANTTLGEAESLLKQRLAKVYAGITRGTIQVNLRIDKASPIKVFILGDVRTPGGYVLQGNSSALQALYFAGGPSELGSVRMVRVERGDTSFTLDLYQYLIFGKRPDMHILHDGDILFIPRAAKLVTIEGDIGRPYIYEVIADEGIRELIEIAGGVNPSVADHRVVAMRFFPGGRKDYVDLENISHYLSGVAKFPLADGDELFIKKSTEESEAHITVLGSVQYPGTYQYQLQMKLADALGVAGGVKKSAYQGRIQILRTLLDGSYSFFASSLSHVNSIVLEPKDTIFVYDQKELHQPDSVTIGGAVARPGRYEYHSGMTVKDLLLIGGGFLPNRQKGLVRIDRLESESRSVDILSRKVSDDYDWDEQNDITLMPWDHVEIPEDPNFYRLQKVRLAGAFRQPGTYSLVGPGESLERLVSRAGSFQDDAYLEGARFYRNGGLHTPKIGQIGVDIVNAMKKDARHNIQLQDGDSIYVPTIMVSVKVSGHVGFPTNVLWRKGKSAEWYIAQAGGLKMTADHERVMIRFANGATVTAQDAERDPDPGSEVIVPFKEPPPPVNWVQIVQASASVFAALATITLAIATIYSLDKK